MGTVTLTKHNRLFWLGRYLERAYAGITATRPLFEADTDGREGDYADYCRKVGIPDTYENTADFVRRFYFDDNDPNSIASALGYAYDNAIVLRETLSTDTLAYVQMAISAMELAAASAAPGVELQWVLDDIMAFRGSCEETIEEESSRNIIKTGASLERVDLCLRLGAPGRCWASSPTRSPPKKRKWSPPQWTDCCSRCGNTRWSIPAVCWPGCSNRR